MEHVLYDTKGNEFVVTDNEPVYLVDALPATTESMKRIAMAISTFGDLMAEKPMDVKHSGTAIGVALEVDGRPEMLLTFAGSYLDDGDVLTSILPTRLLAG